MFLNIIHEQNYITNEKKHEHIECTFKCNLKHFTALKSSHCDYVNCKEQIITRLTDTCNSTKQAKSKSRGETVFLLITYYRQYKLFQKIFLSVVGPTKL